MKITMDLKQARALESAVNTAIWTLTRGGRTQAERHAAADTIVRSMREAGFEIVTPLGVEAVKVVGID